MCHMDYVEWVRKASAAKFMTAKEKVAKAMGSLWVGMDVKFTCEE